MAVAVAAGARARRGATGPTRRSRWSAATRGPAARCWRPRSWPGWPARAPTWSGSACCPRPGVAYLTAEARADLGVMLSASHNPMPDNGIKLFAAGGHKLPGRGRGRRSRPSMADAGRWQRPTGAGVGRVHDLLDGAEHYVKHLVGAVAAPARRAQGRGRLRQRRRRPRSRPRLPGGRRRGHRDPRRAGRPEHQRRLRLDPPRVAARGGARARRRPRHRPRRRRRPLPGRRRRRRRWSTATRSWRSWRWPCARPAR